MNAISTVKHLVHGVAQKAEIETCHENDIRIGLQHSRREKARDSAWTWAVETKNAVIALGTEATKKKMACAESATVAVREEDTTQTDHIFSAQKSGLGAPNKRKRGRAQRLGENRLPGP